MYAVIEANGRQIVVREGETIRLDRVAGGVDETIVFDRVLLAHDGKALQVGSPTVGGASVSARVVRQGKGAKIIVFRYKPKKRQRVRNGHRQPTTELRVEKISLA